MKGGWWALKALMNVLFDWKERAFTRQVRRLTEGKEYDMVFCTTFSTFPLRTALALARERHLPLMVDIRDLDEQVPGTQYQYHRAWWTRPWRKLYSKIEIHRRNNVLRLADCITTVSPWHVRFLQAINPNVHLIYNGFAPQQFYPEDIRTEQFLISYIGRIYEFQDLKLLEECIQELGLPNIRLNLHTPDNNPIALDAVGDEIRRSSVMVVLTNREAKGMMTTKFFEALGCEKPVLCIPDDRGVLSDAIRNCRAGLASDNKEEIKAFIHDKYHEWQQHGFTRQDVNQEHKQRFSRLHQAGQFEQRMLDQMHPTVTVIVPVYNAAKYLKECVESLLAQDCTAHLQIILVDDDSTDNSLQIARSLTSTPDRQIILLSQPHAGQSAARNKALEKATGQYICFVDADDRLDSNYIRTHLQAMHATKADIVQSGYRRVTDEGKTIASILPRHKYRFTVPWAQMYKRETIQGLRFPEGMIYEDVIFSLQLWAKRPRYSLIPYIGYNYRQCDTSTTARPHHRAQDILFTTMHTTKAPWWLKAYTFIRLKIHFRK